ncbi:hypothetical protein HGA13_01615 [Nocardia speluncae]|uniref:Uncharacterized protein n=1 Tax=Nocardia speluncae TaxID=419477 RepID=A0A846X8K7_9NOCA|nr:hypothetical protein [Nocardia speluncae]NKY31775.1 hypothetical protein [Nocardia speluncae]
MTEKFEIDPDEVERGRHLLGDGHDVGLTVVARILQAVSPGSAAWGADEFGAEFAHGPDGSGGFEDFSDSVVAGQDALNHGMDTGGTSLDEVVAVVRQVEENSTRRFG